MRQPCSVQDCGKPICNVGRGLCAMHYRRLRVHGDPLVTTRVYGQGLWARARTKFVETDGCWVWIGNHDQNGYGQIDIGSRSNPPRSTLMAHRVVYEHYVGPIPDGMELDHLCLNKTCVRPTHLEAVSRLVNQQRAEAAGIVPHPKQTHCKRGHELTSDNLYWRPNRARGGALFRTCRTCFRMRQASYRAV